MWIRVDSGVPPQARCTEGMHGVQKALLACAAGAAEAGRSNGAAAEQLLSLVRERCSCSNRAIAGLGSSHAWRHISWDAQYGGSILLHSNSCSYCTAALFQEKSCRMHDRCRRRQRSGFSL